MKAVKTCTITLAKLKYMFNSNTTGVSSRQKLLSCSEHQVLKLFGTPGAFSLPIVLSVLRFTVLITPLIP
jgi:hypothetical protein